MGEGGQGGVSRRAYPSDSVRRDSRQLREHRRNPTERVATSALAPPRESAAGHEKGLRNRCDAVRSGSGHTRKNSDRAYRVRFTPTEQTSGGHAGSAAWGQNRPLSQI